MDKRVYMDYYNTHTQYSKEKVLAMARNYYGKLQEKLQSHMGNEGGFFTTIRIACAIFAADGKIGENEWRMFCYVADASPTYNEFADTVQAVSRDFDGVANEVTRYDVDVRVLSCLLAAAIFCYKGGISQYEHYLLQSW